MLDIKLVREKTDIVKKGIKAKGYDESLVDSVLDLDERKRKLQGEIEDLRSRRNSLAKEKNIEEGKRIKEELKEKEPKLDKIDQKYHEALLFLPNIPSQKSPLGKSDKDNVEVRKWGEPKKFDFVTKDDLQLGKHLGILDFETGAKVTGSQFYFLYGDGALLEMALIQYAIEFLVREGFKPVITPDLAKSRYYLGTGYLPKGKEAQTYVVEGEDLGLIATSEVTLAGKHADEIIPQDKLPLKYVGFSHCFRQEAGAYGKYSKGLYRVHQFAKVEMFIYCLPEESDKYHEYILETEEKIYQSLGLPYRVVDVCTGNLSAMSARTFDIEVWIPSRNDYGEVTSTSNCTDYQARNLNIKFRRKEGKNEYLHMINGTAIATSRTPLAILENYQERDGSVTVPEVLRKWMGKEKIVKAG